MTTAEDKSWDDDPPGAPRSAAAGSWFIVLGMLLLIALGALTFFGMRRGAGPPPAAIAGDPLLVEGREVYLARCMTCHGLAGKGDGPIARSLAGPAPRDLTAPHWKHGDRPEQALDVVTRGVKDTAMAGWGSTLGPEPTRAVTAYVYHLAGRPVPERLRQP